MEKRIKKFWSAGFFLPAINATVFSGFDTYEAETSVDAKDLIYLGLF